MIWSNGAGSWNFDDDFDRNVVIFSVDNSSSYHAGNCKSDFWCCVKEIFSVLMKASAFQRKSLESILVKQRPILIKFALEW